MVLYVFAGLFTIGSVMFMSWSANYFVTYVNNLLAPCEHDGVWISGQCVCDNTGQVWGGNYCDVCQCENSGQCILSSSSDVTKTGSAKFSRYSCSCPYGKWYGEICDQCTATIYTSGTCTGDCLPGYYGPKCSKGCFATKHSSHCLGLLSEGGDCNACNNNGVCSATGECVCASDWFTTRDGEQCASSCRDLEIDCGQHGTCAVAGGRIACVCESDYYGDDCEIPCPGIESGLTCSGHGQCGFTGETRCECQSGWTGENCEFRCPGEQVCSGHGSCMPDYDLNRATCSCASDWYGDSCTCNPLLTCAGHGECDNEVCVCDDIGKCDNDQCDPVQSHWSGDSCHVCAENWWGSDCQLYCKDDLDYSDGFKIGCNRHGTCYQDISEGQEFVSCECRDNTDLDYFCRTCEPGFYPDINLVDIETDACSVECSAHICSDNGYCNENWLGNPDDPICICYPVGNLDTVDPKMYCSKCREHWYPNNMNQDDKCTRYCNSDAKVINIGVAGNDQIKNVITINGSSNYLTNGDTAKVCTVYQSKDSTNSTYLLTDPDCRVCSGSGICQESGDCYCDSGVTGSYCEVNCAENDRGLVCSNHGTCMRNDLDLWFNPGTKQYRCECNPTDMYTSETRQRFTRRGFELDPPPAKEYYGEFCDYHCPRYNQKICADRGECSVNILSNLCATDDECGGQSKCTHGRCVCYSDNDCTSGFCRSMTLVTRALLSLYIQMMALSVVWKRSVWMKLVKWNGMDIVWVC